MNITCYLCINVTCVTENVSVLCVAAKMIRGRAVRMTDVLHVFKLLIYLREN